MFQHKTAWFSNSVPLETHNFWISERGTLAGWRDADYLFSADAECPDTVRIFESKDYLWNKVTIFHHQFLSICERWQSTKSVCIGHYVLPPASVQDEVRKVIGRFLWECEDEEEEFQQTPHPLKNHQNSQDGVSISDGMSNSSHAESSENQTPLSTVSFNQPNGYEVAGFISMSHLQKYTGDLWDFKPSCFRCSKCKVHCCCFSQR